MSNERQKRPIRLLLLLVFAVCVLASAGVWLFARLAIWGGAAWGENVQCEVKERFLLMSGVPTTLDWWDIYVAPSGRDAAYVVKEDKSWWVVRVGRRHGPFMAEPRIIGWDPQGHRLAYLAKVADGPVPEVPIRQVWIDGNPIGFPSERIGFYGWTQDGHFVHAAEGRGSGYSDGDYLLVDGRAIGPFLFAGDWGANPTSGEIFYIADDTIRKVGQESPLAPLPEGWDPSSLGGLPVRERDGAVLVQMERAGAILGDHHYFVYGPDGWVGPLMGPVDFPERFGWDGLGQPWVVKSIVSEPTKHPRPFRLILRGETYGPFGKVYGLAFQRGGPSWAVCYESSQGSWVFNLLVNGAVHHLGMRGPAEDMTWCQCGQHLFWKAPNLTSLRLTLYMNGHRIVEADAIWLLGIGPACDEVTVAERKGDRLEVSRYALRRE